VHDAALVASELLVLVFSTGASAAEVSVDNDRDRGVVRLEIRGEGLTADGSHVLEVWGETTRNALLRAVTQDWHVEADGSGASAWAELARGETTNESAAGRTRPRSVSNHDVTGYA
jgi:hypothetical protein